MAEQDSEAPAAKRARVEQVAAFVGGEGSLSHTAASTIFEKCSQTRLVSCNTVNAVFETVTSGRADYGVVPAENSSTGTLHSVYEMLMQHDLVIGGEIGMPEKYCLATRPGAGLADISQVLSHSNILDACSGFLETRLKSGIDLVPTRTTTEAAQRVAGSELNNAAAIVSREAAKIHKLTVLASDIGNDKHVQTRYILVHLRNYNGAVPFPQESLYHAHSSRKHTAAFALLNEPGAVFKLMSCFALRGVNVLRIDSRPVATGTRAPPSLQAQHRLWDYIMFVEYTDPPKTTKEESSRLWEALVEFSVWQRDFGSYPSHLTKEQKQPQSWTDMVDIMCKA